jgi:ribosomal protein S24E
MKLEITSQKKNPIMGREEAEVRINHVGQRTPTRQEIAKAVSSHLKISESHVIVDRIITVQGQTISNAKVLAYEKAESIPAYMLEKMKRRTKAEAEAPVEKAAA